MRSVTYDRYVKHVRICTSRTCSIQLHFCFDYSWIFLFLFIYFYYRTVCLCFDAMAIDECLQYSKQFDLVEGFADLGNEQRSKAVASHALVFMIRGATRKWKQVIGYFLYDASLSWSILQTLLYSALQFCAESGLKVICVVCDQESSQMKLWRELGVSPSTPYIVDPDKGHKICVLPDPPHLLKSLRNNLMKHDIQVCMNFLNFLT